TLRQGHRRRPVGRHVVLPAGGGAASDARQRAGPRRGGVVNGAARKPVPRLPGVLDPDVEYTLNVLATARYVVDEATIVIVRDELPMGAIASHEDSRRRALAVLERHGQNPKVLLEQAEKLARSI